MVFALVVIGIFSDPHSESDRDNQRIFSEPNNLTFGRLKATSVLPKDEDFREAEILDPRRQPYNKVRTLT